MAIAVTLINNIILPVFYENHVLNCYEVRLKLGTAINKLKIIILFSTLK